MRQQVLVDWRQLRRWGLDERRLPSDSRVLFRTPTVWEEYRWAIVSAFVLLMSQTVVVVALLFERRRRRHAQDTLEERLRFETVLTEISAGFANVPESARQEPGVEPPVPATAAEHQVREGLRRVAETLGAEGASLWRFSEDGRGGLRRPVLDA